MKNNNTDKPLQLDVTSYPAQSSILPEKKYSKKRIFTISAIAVLIAASISIIAKLLIYLLDLITNISFYGKFSFEATSPADNHLGLFVIAVPVIGGLIVGLMAMYGSKAIRGHGIPEAMEQILTNQSKIKPTITYLKPISAAISIGTGGPFGAEGPIISTGGALGSTLGQLIKITHNERKILLAAGATAGMAAIFSTPIAGIFLAIELLLFEFSPRSFIPVALACITGAAGHHIFFGNGVVFPLKETLAQPSNYALTLYAIIGIVVGIASIIASKITYWIEDGFEKLPVHWALWPAIGGIAVGVVGYFAPRTLGVGYNNITDVLSGNMTVSILVSLCVLKFVSWAISLGSGTSGGTLAPLLTIGGALGALLGTVIIQYMPNSGVVVPMAAVVGMAAMFAGASRAFLTSVIFALESTGQYNALLPLLAACTVAYLISYFFMDNTIMTEKIARRGIVTPISYQPDLLEKIKVAQALTNSGVIISNENTVREAREWIKQDHSENANYFIISDNEGKYKGILSASNLFSNHHALDNPIGSLVKRNSIYVGQDDTLRNAVEIMAKENIDILPVVSTKDMQVVGALSYHDIIAVYKENLGDDSEKKTVISLRRNGLKILLRGQKLASAIKKKEK